MLHMTPKVLKNLFSRSATRLYPTTKREPFPNVRGALKIKIEDCIFCSMCSRKCPSQCIKVDKKAYTWEMDPFSCVYCGICVDICPTSCLYQTLAYRPPETQRFVVFRQGEAPEKQGKDKQNSGEQTT